MKVVRYVEPRACRDATYTDAIGDLTSAVIDTLSSNPNVSLYFTIDGKPLRPALKSSTRDFLDLAATVYVADELLDRDLAEDGWNRRFDFVIPVRDPETWSSAEDILSHTLQTLSGDVFAFQWCERKSLGQRGRSRKRLPRAFDDVCLFSGGLDSLLGAYRLLRQGRKVILVSHQADGISASTQKSLSEDLRTIFPDQVCHVQCRVARSMVRRPAIPLPDKCEDSHRPRSFLFLAIAIAVANAAGIGDVWIPENGLIALNIPIKPSRRGTLSTKTAHPLFIEQLTGFLHDTGIFGGTIRNPFLFQSKTDLLSEVDELVRPLVVKSNSCAHAGNVRWMGKSGIAQCGYCVPCIYRRLAMAREGMDNPEHYVVDVFRDLPGLSSTQQRDFRALVPFAVKLLAASDAELQLLILSQGAFSPEIAGQIGLEPQSDYSVWTSMLRRWANDCLETTEARASEGVRAILGTTAGQRRYK